MKQVVGGKRWEKGKYTVRRHALGNFTIENKHDWILIDGSVAREATVAYK